MSLRKMEISYPLQKMTVFQTPPPYGEASRNLSVGYENILSQILGRLYCRSKFSQDLHSITLLPTKKYWNQEPTNLP